jgi:predicted Fe-S protein YdhL (DUF1289 family)
MLQPPTDGDLSAAQRAIKKLAAHAQLARVMVQNIPSPCISVCQMNPGTELCVGCWRTLDEIAGWSRASDANKHTIWARIAQRIEQSTGPTP